MPSAELRKPVGILGACKRLLLLFGLASLLSVADLKARQALAGGGPTLPITGAQFQNPRPTTVPLSDVVMVDASNGWAVGAYGVILRTNDGGLTWVNDPSSPALATGDSLNGLHFLDSTFGAAVGQNGLILLFNGVTNQWAVANPSSPGPALLAVQFVDNQVGYAVGEMGLIKTTNDGGTTWTDQTSGVTENLFGLHFVDGNNGFAVGSLGTLLATTDGGTTWTPQTSGTSGTLADIVCQSALVCWAVGDEETILYTADGGSTWTQQYFTSFSGPLSRVQIVSTDVFASGGSAVLHTSDAGTTWTPLTSPGSLTNAIFFQDSLNAVAVGYGTDEVNFWATVNLTNDGGSTWQAQNLYATAENLNAVHMVNNQEGFAVGSTGVVLSTMDGGQSWTPETSGVSNNLQAVDFPVDATTGWAVGDTGTILSSVDNGVSWTPQTSGVTETLYGLDMVDNTTGWAVGTLGTILVTTDGGGTWTPQTSGVSATLMEVAAINASTAVVVGDAGTALKTTDGGTTWSPIVVDQVDLISVTFPTATVGYVGSNVGGVYQTTDGGDTWSSPQPTGAFFPIEDIACVTPDACVATTSKPEILKTTDGGATWSLAGMPGPVPLYGVAVAAAAQSPFWAVGSAGWILKDSLGVTAADTTPPTPVAAVYDGDVPQMDEDETMSSGYLLFNWEAASDTESGVDHYLITLEMYDNMAEAWTVVSGPDSAGADLFTYVLGPFDEGLYRATVVAVNGEGLQSDPASSDGITVVPDTIPPTGGAIAYADGEATSASVTVDLTVGYDSESGLTTTGQLTQTTADYDSESCGAFGAETFVADVSFDNLFSRKTGRGASVVTGPDLSVDAPLGETGLCYQFQWTVTDFAGNPATYTSSAIVRVPFVPPPPSLSVSAVLDGLSGDDADFTTSQDTLAVRWTPPPAEAGEVLAYVVSVGTAAGLDDVASTSVLVGETQAVFEGLSLAQGATYYANVAVLDSRETPGPAQSSDGITVDTTPPAPVATITPSAFIGPSVTQPGMTMTSLGAEWTASEDGESGVTGYSFSVGATPGGSDFLAPNTLAANGFNLQDLDLVSGTTYYITVQAINGAGLLSEAVTSEGVTPTDSTTGGGDTGGGDTGGEGGGGVSPSLVLQANAVDLGLNTPGSFSLEGVVSVQASGSAFLAVRLQTAALALVETGENPPARAASVAAQMVVGDPAVITEIPAGETTSLLVKVMLPAGSAPGRYEGPQLVYADQNGDGQWGEGEPVASFLLSVEVPDFSALGATCPVQDMTLQDPPAQSTPARQAPGSEGGAP